MKVFYVPGDNKMDQNGLDKDGGIVAREIAAR